MEKLKTGAVKFRRVSLMVDEVGSIKEGDITFGGNFRNRTATFATPYGESVNVSAPFSSRKGAAEALARSLSSDDEKTHYWTVKGTHGRRKLVESNGHKLISSLSVIEEDGKVALVNPHGDEVDKTSTFLSRSLALFVARRRVRPDGAGGYLFSKTLKRRGK